MYTALYWLKTRTFRNIVNISIRMQRFMFKIISRVKNYIPFIISLFKIHKLFDYYKFINY